MSKLKFDFGIETHEFMSEIFEKNFKYFPNALNSREYTWEMLNSDFHNINPVTGNMIIYKNGIQNHRSYSNSFEDFDKQIRYDFDENKLHTLLNDGATIVVNGFDKSSITINALCHKLSVMTNFSTVANAYITKGGSGTFGKHWDTHCVFATQIKGSKLWRIYKPTLDLPLPFQTSSQEKEFFNKDPVFEIVINEGDVLYIPRGWWHVANPIQNIPSVHISFGIHTPKLFNYIKWVLEKKMSQDIDFRRSINSDHLINKEAINLALNKITNSLSSIEIFEEFNREASKISIKTREINIENLLKAY